MKPEIGVQLYSVREALDRDFQGTMEQIANIGFAGVETAFFGENITPKEARHLFDALGLSVIGAHCSLPLGDGEQNVLSLLNDLQAMRAVWHGWPEEERYRTVESIRALAELFNRANAVCRAHGLSFGLHNHWWEFQTVGSHTAVEHLRPLLDLDIFFELDSYWIQTAGHNPAEVITDFGDAAPLIHLKDGPATKEDVMVALGTGSMDTPSIVNAARPTAGWLIVELDTVDGDIFEALSQSYDYLKGCLSND